MPRLGEIQADAYERVRVWYRTPDGDTCQTTRPVEKVDDYVAYLLRHDCVVLRIERV